MSGPNHRYHPGVTRVGVRSIAGAALRLVLWFGLVVLLAGTLLVVLAYYTALEFDVEAVALALVVVGVLLFLWRRTR